MQTNTTRPLPPAEPRSIARARLELRYMERAYAIASRPDATEQELADLGHWFRAIGHNAYRFTCLAEARAYFAA